jgi:hypothetical protein
MTPPEELADAFRAHLQACGYIPRSGASEIEIAAFERRHSVQLPSDLREFLLRVNGTTDYPDDLLTRFWPLDEVKPLDATPSEGQTARYFVIADQMMSAPDFAIALDRPPACVVRYWGANWKLEPVCCSFSEFARLFMEDPWAIHVRTAPSSTPPC